MTPRAPRLSASLLLAASAVLAALALVDPHAEARAGAVLRVLVHDASASCGARAPDAAERERLVRGLHEDDTVAVVEFGATARIVVPPCAPSRLPDPIPWVPIDPRGSSVGRALELAAELPAGDRARDVLLASDARATDRDELRSVAAVRLAAAGCRSFATMELPSATLDAVVQELRGPGAARVGEPFVLAARGVAATADAQVELVGEAGVVETRRIPQPGPFNVAFVRSEEESGPATFSARFAGARDLPQPIARVAVTAPGSVLVVADGAERPAVLAMLPNSRAVDVRELSPELLAAHDCVVVDGVPDATLSAATPLLSRFVRGGGGLVLFGGAHAFGAGGWAGRPIEEVSALLSRPRDEEGALLYVAVDGSGSMATPWDGVDGAATSDDVVRAAARSLVRSAAADTTLVLRRFAGSLVPADSAAARFRLDDTGRERAIRAIDAFPPPDGPTALVPPLAEALSVAASRRGPHRRVLLFSDGRSAESSSAIHAALAALDAADVAVTFVMPGEGRLDSEAHALVLALQGTRAEVIGARTPEALARTFREIEQRTRIDDPFAEGVELRAAETAGVLSPDAIPRSASRVDRAWLAEGARPLLVTGEGAAVAALRRVGLGASAALATSPGDDAWLPDSRAARLLATALVRAVTRPAAGRLRVERESATRILIHMEASAGPDRASAVAGEIGGRRIRVPLVASGRGLLAADIPPELPWIDVVDAEDRVLLSGGLDEPAPPEYLGPARADLAKLAALAQSGGPPHTRSLRPWFAAAAILLVVVAAARVKSGAGRAR